MKKFKTIILGCGNIAGGYDTQTRLEKRPLTHAGAYLAHGGFELIGCLDPDFQKRTDFQQKWGVPVGLSNLAEFNEHNFEVDVVSICSPTDVHPDHLRAALKWNPKLVFCEKPVTGSVTQTEEWVGRYESQGVALAVNHTRRWAADVNALKREFERQEWGKIRSISALYNKGVLNNGSHLFDLLHYLLGPLKVLAVGRERFDFWSGDPSIPSLLETVSGVPVTVNIGSADDYSLFEVQFVTERGLLHMKNGGMSWSKAGVVDSHDFPGYRSLGDDCVQQGHYREAMLVAMDNLYRAMTENADLLSTGRTALQAQRVCGLIRGNAAEASSLSGSIND